MLPPLFLTCFLLIAGLFTLWCSAKNYDWFFNYPGTSGTFIRMIGRPVARGFYIILSLVLIGWGAARVVEPPREIPTAFVFDLASPDGIVLLPPVDAVVSLKNSKAVNSLEVDDGGWVSFWIKLDKEHPDYIDAADATVAGPDFREGFALRGKTFRETRFEGRIVYFNDAPESCNNVLFSKRPLDSAAFIMVICSEEASEENGVTDGLMVWYFRAGTSAYTAVK